MFSCPADRLPGANRTRDSEDERKKQVNAKFSTTTVGGQLDLSWFYQSGSGFVDAGPGVPTTADPVSHVTSPFL